MTALVNAFRAEPMLTMLVVLMASLPLVGVLVTIVTGDADWLLLGLTLVFFL
jgi:hypothetical protein